MNTKCSLACAFVTLLGAEVFAIPPLDLNDVSWLLPPVQSKEDLAEALVISQLLSASGKPVWSNEQFCDLLTAADSDAAAVDCHRIKLADSLRNKDAWCIAGIRFDPSAPGVSDEIREQFGGSSQIRLIVQPVTRTGDQVTVHDVAVHLVYSFDGSRDARQRIQPDLEKTKDIVNGLDELKANSESGGVPTAGLPLAVHPGLAKKIPGLREKLIIFLSRHLDAERLTAMSIMGIEPPEPWLFLALAKFPTGNLKFAPVPFLPTQMVRFGSTDLAVLPALATNNRNPMTANLLVPAQDKRGVSTAALFGLPPGGLKSLATIHIGNGQPEKDPKLINADIADFVANPTLCHFFNTDCASCHTETRRRARLALPPSTFAYLRNGGPTEIAQSALPKDDWNVHNFGWFPPSPFIGGGPTVPTVTQRTANETAEVVLFIERVFRAKN